MKGFFRDFGEQVARMFADLDKTLDEAFKDAPGVETVEQETKRTTVNGVVVEVTTTITRRKVTKEKR